MSLSNNFPTIRPTLNLDFANSGVLDPRITFTRTTTATYYDAETVAKAEENLLLQSQTFNNTPWTVDNSTVSADFAVAPDGTNTADRLLETATTNVHAFSQTLSNISAAQHVFSIYLKKGSGATAPDWIQLTFGGASTGFANFNLSTGAVGVTDFATATISNAGSGWYRCSAIVSVAVAGAASVQIVFTNNTNSATRRPSYAGATTSDVLVWGAQLEQRSAVTAYTPTTTQAITNYIPQLMTAAAGQPRFDYDPITRAAKGLLIEEVRTNLATYSDAVNSWSSNVSVTIAPNAITSPDGTVNADKVSPDASGAGFYAQTITAISGSVTYTASVYLKAAEVTSGVVITLATSSLWPTSVGPSITVNLSTGAITATTNVLSSSITNVGNGWYRVAFTQTSTGAGNSGIRVSPTAGVAGNGWNGIYVWGAQLEAGAFATSYIPTVAASVQRNADAASMTGTNFSSWYSQNVGTFVARADAYSVTAYGPLAVARNSATALQNRIDFSTNAGVTAQTSRLTVTTNNVTQADTVVVGPTITPNTAYTFAGAFATNDFISALQGSLSSADTSGTVPAVDIFEIGNRTPSGAAQLNGHLQYLRYYPLRLTNAQLQNLTKS